MSWGGQDEKTNLGKQKKSFLRVAIVRTLGEVKKARRAGTVNPVREGKGEISNEGARP